MSSRSDSTLSKSDASFATRKKGMQLIRTCQSCVAAKVRCVRQPKATTCDRCQRLDKECFYRKARRRQHGDESDARIEALETRIEQLLSTKVVETPSSYPAQSFDVSSRESSHDAIQSNAHQNPAGTRMYAQSSQSHPDSASSLSLSQSIFEGFFTSDEANALLNSFRSTMNHHFPFVVVPLHVSAEELATEKPFLLLAVLAAASHENMPLQKHLCDEVKSTVSDRIIMECDISLDMLQGLLIYLAWCHYHPRPRQYPQLINLAMSLVSEWALDVPSRVGDWKTHVHWYMAGSFTGEVDTNDYPSHVSNSEPDVNHVRRRNRTRTPEDYRAMLGCYYLAANVAILLGKRNAFTYSPFIEEVARYFTENPEHPTDKYLLYHVQFQHLLEKIDRVSLNRSENMDATHVIGAWAATLKAELDILKESLPFAVEESFSLLMQIRSTELFLFQLSLPDKQYPISRGPASWDPMRMELLASGLIATTQIFSAFLALPFNTEKSFTNSEWIQLAASLLIGSKLAVASAAQAVARQTQSLRRGLAFGAILKQLRVRLGALVSPLVDGRGDRDTFYNFEKRVDRIEQWYLENFSKATQLATTSTEPPIPTAMVNDVDPMWSTGLGPSPQAPLQAIGSDMPSINIDDSYQAAGLDSDPLLTDPNYSFYFPDSVVAEIMGEWTSDAAPLT